MSDLFTTERLAVRKFLPEDHEDLAEILTDPDVTYFEPYETFTKEKCVDEAEAFSKSEEFFAVVCDNKVIGKIYFSKRGIGSFEIGWTFNAEYQGKGYACESVRGMINYAFSKMGARRIIAEINTRNSRSVKLAERLGMTRTAVREGGCPRKEDASALDDMYVYELRKKDTWERKKPVISIITSVVMIVFVILTISEPYISIPLWSFWAICLGAMFLAECLGGLTKKRLAPNIGVFAVDLIIAAAFVFLFLATFADEEDALTARAFIGLFFLPPVIVSLIANIVSILRKI